MMINYKSSEKEDLQRRKRNHSISLNTMLSSMDPFFSADSVNPQLSS